jgi:hypothetical protein
VKASGLFRIIFILFALSVSHNSFAQDEFGKDLYLAPGIRVGYTIGGGFNFGFDVDAGLFRMPVSNFPMYGGISYTQNWIITKRRVLRIRSMSIFTESRYFDFKIGHGSMKDPKSPNVNNSSVSGLSIDGSVTYNELYYPWIGVRTFWYNYLTWMWFDREVITPYMKYKYDIIGNAQLRNDSAPAP